MQERYGSANFSRWQSIRKEFYSYINYPTAGSTSFTFFGFGLNGSTTQGYQYTNMPKAGSFGQVHFLVKQIRLRVLLLNASYVQPAAATDAASAVADIMHGFAQAGELDWVIGDKKYVELPKPFMYAPPADGQVDVKSQGSAFTLTEAAPNTQANTFTGIPFAQLLTRKQAGYLVDPNVLIEAEQNFSLTLNYPSGALPILGTSIWNGTNFAIGVGLDGILFRPVQ